MAFYTLYRLFRTQSVGLGQKYVQMLMDRIRLACLLLGSSQYWSWKIRNAVLAINTRCIRIHGYTPAEILLGFNPSSTRKTDAGFDQWAKQTIALDEPENTHQPNEHYLHSFVDSCDERGLRGGEELARKQDSVIPKRTAGHHKPKEGDLVLVRDIALAKEYGRKLEARWTTPCLLEWISFSGVSGHVHQLHDPPGKTKRFHLDDLLLYIPHDSDYPKRAVGEPDVPATRIQYSRAAMGNVQLVLGMGGRGFDLSDIVMRERSC